MRAARSRVVVALGAAACVLLVASPAGAMPLDTSAEIPQPGGVAVSVIAREQVSSVPPNASTTVMDQPSTFVGAPQVAAPIPVVAPDEAFAPQETSFQPAPCLRRRVGGSWGDTLSFCVADDPPEGRRGRASPSPEDVARVLADRARSLAPTPRIEIAPESVGLTGLESFFWVEPPGPVRAAAGVGGITVVAEARPVQYVWSFGDGSGLVSNHPGVPRHTSDERLATVTHTYETDGSREVIVEQIWEARWRSGAGEWQALGFFSETGIRVYPVRAIVPVIVAVR
jgi:hypothetical protein